MCNARGGRSCRSRRLWCIEASTTNQGCAYARQNWLQKAKERQKWRTNWSLISRAEKSYLSINNKCFLWPPVLTRYFMWTAVIHSMIKTGKLTQSFLSLLFVKTWEISTPIPCDKSSWPPSQCCCCCNLGVLFQIEWSGRSHSSLALKCIKTNRMKWSNSLFISR